MEHGVRSSRIGQSVGMDIKLLVMLQRKFCATRLSVSLEQAKEPSVSKSACTTLPSIISAVGFFRGPVIST